MGIINIPRDEQAALKSLDPMLLRALIDQCLREERFTALRQLSLGNCGLFVSTKRDRFERALDAYAKAKAAKKREETLRAARRAGSDLLNAVEQMHHRMETEEEEGERFYVDDLITPPYTLGVKLSVCVRYRWRPAPTESWALGDITFLYDVDLRPDYSRPPPARKPNAAKQAQDREDILYREWEHLKDQALFSVRDYFQAGGNGADIPKTFQVIPDVYSRGLNNHSTKFWLTRNPCERVGWAPGPPPRQ